MMRKPGMLGLKIFWQGKLRVEKVWAQNISTHFLVELDYPKKKQV